MRSESWGAQNGYRVFVLRFHLGTKDQTKISEVSGSPGGCGKSQGVCLQDREVGVSRVTL